MPWPTMWTFGSFGSFGSGSGGLNQKAKPPTFLVMPERRLIGRVLLDDKDRQQ